MEITGNEKKPLANLTQWNPCLSAFAIPTLTKSLSNYCVVDLNKAKHQIQL
jgi:hypothetical protein